MEIITPKKLEEMTKLNKRKMEQLLPEMVERLLLEDNMTVNEHRFPFGDSIWVRGYDGVAFCEKSSGYVCEGKSVWEFGTSDNSLRKIEEDYCKRTQNSLGINKKETGFYLVLPKIWAYNTSITEWEANHNDWRFAKVYDAVSLCGWINKYPAVIAWLLEEIYGDTNLDFSSLSAGWDRFSNKTNPALVKEMFIQYREEQITQFINKLTDEKGNICIKASTRIDSIGFALTVLLDQETISHKCIVVNTIEAFRRITEMSEGKIILLTYPHEGELYNNKNRIITCCNNEATSILDAIELPQLSKSVFESTLIKMGISNGEITDIYAFTHGNLRALIRRIPGNYIEQQPDWAKNESLEALVPLVLLRSIDKNKDRELAEKLSNNDFTYLERQYYSLSLLDDAPLKIVQNHYVIVNYEEAWSTLGLSPNEYHFDKLVQLISELFESLSKTGKFAGRYFGEYKEIVRRLIWNFVYYSYEKDEEGKIEKAIRKLLPWIYDERISEYLIDNLFFLASTRPRIVKDFLFEDYKNKKGIIRKTFEEDDYRNLYCGFLQAFDELATYYELLPDVSTILFELFLLNKKYRYSSCPEESLLNALCLWRCEGTVTLSEKERIIMKILNQYPKESIDLFAKLIGKDSFYKVVRIGERDRRRQGETIIFKDLLITKERIVDALFIKAIEIRKASLILSVIKNYRDISPKALEKYSENINLDDYDELEVYELNFWLRKRVFNIRRYGWDESEQYIEPLKTWEKTTEYVDKLKRNRWVFRSAYDCPAEELLNNIDNYQIAEKEKYEYRKTIIKDLYDSYEDEAINALSEMISNESYWGFLFTEIIPKEKMVLLFHKLMKEEKYLSLAKTLDNANETISATFLREIGDERKKILALLSNRNLLSSFDEEESRLFWSKKEMFSYEEEVYCALLKYHPNGIIPWLYLEREKISERYIEIAQEVLKAIGEEENIDRNSHYEIEDIIARIDETYYSDEWGEICMHLLLKDIISNYPLCACKLLFLKPELIRNVIDFSFSSKFRFKENYFLPKCAYEDYGSFKYFFDYLRSLNGQENFYGIMETLLGKNVVGNDGLYPHEFVRRILEEFNSIELDNDVADSFENLSKIRMVTDGLDQREKAKEYKEIAKKLLIEYPHSSNVLNRISMRYEEDAKRDYIDSEVRIY